MNNTAYLSIKRTGKLPSPSGVALELMRMVDDESSPIDRIITTVESDPAIASRLIKLVNSSLTGAPRKIASISMAVKLLGRHTVKNLALGLSLLASNRENISQAFDFERFWSESLARAVAARSLTALLGCCAADEAFTVALLSQVGQLALASVFPEKYDKILEIKHSTENSKLGELEREAFMIDHHELTAEMMTDWGLADIFCVAVRQPYTMGGKVSEDDSRVVQMSKLLHLAGSLASVLIMPKVYREDLTDLLVEAETLDVVPEVLSELFELVKEEWHELGSIFSVQTHETPSLQETHTRASRQHHTVLVVDDDPAILRLLTHYLTDVGYDVHTALNGHEALQIIHTQGCHLVITDLVMPEMDGLQLCRAIRESEGVGFVYLIVLTGHASKDSPEEAFEAGVDDFLSKPCQRGELLARLNAGVRMMELQVDLSTQQRATHKTNAELATLNDKLHKIATTDELTGLYNRREAMRRLEVQWVATNRDDRSFACMLLDIDHFKRFNDTYGHDVGDNILRRTAQILEHFARVGETVYRIGGEEFVILCPGATAKMASVGAERLRSAVESNSIKLTGVNIHVTISIGVAERNHLTLKADDLLKLADDALYEAKHKGRNRVCMAESHQSTVSAQPQREHASSEPAVRADKPVRREGCRGLVLVVDDEPSTRRLIRALLEQDGFQISEACDGQDALDQLRGIHPDVILMDVLMPNLDGLACTRIIQADPVMHEIPIIMVTGQADKEHVEAAFEAGAREFITKPFQHREFILRVRSMTELYRGKTDLVTSNGVRGEQARAMELLFDLSRTFTHCESIESILDEAVIAVAKLLGCRRVSIMLPDQERKNLTIAKMIGMEGASAEEIHVLVGQPIAGQVFATGQPIIYNRTSNERSTHQWADHDFFISTPLASLALTVSNKVLGVLNVTDRFDGKAFEAHELEYLDLVGNMTASALEQFQAHQQRERAHSAIVTGLAKLAEHRDTDTGNHLERVTQYALILAQELSKSKRYVSLIDKTFLEDLNQAMPLHDIGKVAVPDSILLKNGKLTDTEFATMQKHAEIGARAIQSVIEQAPEARFLKMAKDIALAHHERFDGTGYPQGLRAEAIPLAARIAAVADVYDALTTKQPYKKAFHHDQARSLISKEGGKHFDATVVKAFLHREQEFAELADKLKEGGDNLFKGITQREAIACSVD